jgi:DNA-binding transcriptional ArsR family regulator
MAATDAFTAISDPHRRYLLEAMRGGSKSVRELADGLPVSRPAVSQHLKVLLETGLVNVQAVGTKRLYEINPHGMLKLNIWLDQFWQD